MAWALLFLLPDSVMGYETVYLSAFGRFSKSDQLRMQKNPESGNENNFKMKNTIFPHKFWGSF